MPGCIGGNLCRLSSKSPTIFIIAPAAQPFGVAIAPCSSFGSLMRYVPGHVGVRTACAFHDEPPCVEPGGVDSPTGCAGPRRGAWARQGPSSIWSWPLSGSAYGRLSPATLGRSSALRPTLARTGFKAEQTLLGVAHTEPKQTFSKRRRRRTRGAAPGSACNSGEQPAPTQTGRLGLRKADVQRPRRTARAGFARVGSNASLGGMGYPGLDTRKRN